MILVFFFPCFPCFRGEDPILERGAVSEHPLQLRAAYSVCRHIARSAARNFYYGFLLLPAPQAQRACRRCTPSCATPTISPTTRRFRRSSDVKNWTSGWTRCAVWWRASAPTIPCCSRWPIRRSSSTSRSICWKSWCMGRRWMFRPPADAPVSNVAIERLRSALRLLLSRCVGCRAGLHSHLRLSRSAGGEAGGGSWSRVSAHQHPARCERRCRTGTRVSATRRLCALRNRGSHDLTNGSAPTVAAAVAGV